MPSRAPGVPRESREHSCQKRLGASDERGPASPTNPRSRSPCLETRQEAHRALGGPEAPGRHRGRDKADMTAGVQHLAAHDAGDGQRPVDDRRRGNQWIVLRNEHEHGVSDLLQLGPRATACVIVVRVPESAIGRRDRLVELRMVRAPRSRPRS